MRFLPLIFMIFLIGCFKESSATTTVVVRGTSGTNYTIERLFTIDGCGVYRFADAEKAGYFSICPQVVCSTAEKVCPSPTPKQHKLEEN